MSWSWEQIDREWLRGNRIAVSPADAVEAFNRAEEILGPSWIAGCRGPTGNAVGLVPTLYVLTTGQLLAAVAAVPGADHLFERIRRRDASAEAELTAIFLLSGNRPDTRVELEPEVSV